MRCWNTVHVILWDLPVEHAGDVGTQADMLLAVLSPKWLIPVPDIEANTTFCNEKTMYV